MPVFNAGTGLAGLGIVAYPNEVNHSLTGASSFGRFQGGGIGSAIAHGAGLGAPIAHTYGLGIPISHTYGLGESAFGARVREFFSSTNTYVAFGVGALAGAFVMAVLKR